MFYGKQQMHQNKIAFNGVEHNIINGSIIFDKDDGCGMVIDILDDQCVNALDFLQSVSILETYDSRHWRHQVYRCNNDKIGKKGLYTDDIIPLFMLHSK